jgi:hypothetical protein
MSSDIDFQFLSSVLKLGVHKENRCQMTSKIDFQIAINDTEIEIDIGHCQIEN